MTPSDAIRTAYADLQASRFDQALAAVADVRHTAPGRLLHALALAGSGEVAGAAPLLAAIAVANPGHQHPVLDLLTLIPVAAAPAQLRAALALRPDDAALHGALGTALAETGPMDAAIAAFSSATALSPTDAAAWANLGKALAAEARFAAADAAFAAARRLAPSDARIAHHHALAVLKSGRWAEGWAALRVRHGLPGRKLPLPGPRLLDLNVSGRTVLLVQDEGLGDTLQFIRYAEPLAALGARVMAAVPPSMRRIVATVPGVAETVSLDLLPRYDFWAPLLDVPALFGASIPGRVPYLRAGLVAPALPGGRRVGITWAGDARSAADRHRSIAADVLAPLRSVAGVTWVSLQKDRPAPDWMVDPMPAVRDFADTAAIIAQLDIVVSVDTAVAHLAGGLGVPVMLLDRYDSCWRWLTGRTDSPWYPGLRIFRQRSPGDWAGAVAAVADALSLGAETPG